MHTRESGNIFFSHKFWNGYIPYTVIIFIIFNLFIANWRKALEVQRQANLLQNSNRYDLQGNSEIRFDLSNGGETAKYLKYIPDATKNPLVVLTGMSQMYAINDVQPGDKTISEWMDDSLRLKGIRVFGMAAPNITNEEALLVLLNLVSDTKTCPKIFIYGVCFDKFRNVDLRHEYEILLLKNPSVREIWKGVSDEFSNQYPIAAEKMKSSLTSLYKNNEADNSIESDLRRLAGRYIPVVHSVRDINGWLQIRIFYLRNWLFNIKPTSKRPIIESRYLMNRQFLELLADVCKKYKVKLIYYVIPLNPMSDNPYIPDEYQKFKSWLSDLCAGKDIAFANLESVVPQEDWGEFMGGPDFKHFRGAGHKITADAIINEFKNIFDKI